MIEIKDLIKHYNKGRSNAVKALDGVSLTLPDTGFIGILGRSGCGKTTLLNAIGGTTKISSGKILINGEDLYKDTDNIRNRNIGYIFQNYLLIRDETVFENVADCLILSGVTDPEEIEKRVNEALDYVGMGRYRNRKPDSLSGGQQQRIAIARAIVKRPAILLADEPTGNLDKNNTIGVMDILKKISKDHLVILVTHEKELAEEYCDRIIEMNDGKITNKGKDFSGSGKKAEKNDISKDTVTGRLFDLKKSFKQSMRSTGIKKKSVVILGIFLILSTFMTVLLTGHLSVSINYFIEKIRSRDADLFYIDPNNVKGLDSISEIVSDNASGIDAVSILHDNEGTNIGHSDFSLPDFRSSNWKFSELPSSNYVECSYWDASLIKDVKPAAGKSAPDKGEVVITTAIAQKMIDNIHLSAINSPEDVLGFGFYGLDNTASEDLKIAGVIESEKNYAYCCREDIDRAYFSVCSPEDLRSGVSQSDKVPAGKVTVKFSDKALLDRFKSGDKITVNGQRFEIGDVIDAYFPYSEYIKTQNISKKSKVETDMDDLQYTAYYMEEYGDYINYCLEHEDTVNVTSYMKAYADGNDSLLYFLKAREVDDDELSYYLFTKDYLKREPSEREIDDMRPIVDRLHEKISRLINYNDAYKVNENQIEYTFNPEDYKLCADSVGISDYHIEKDHETPAAKLLLHSTDPEKTKVYLKEKFGEGTAVTAAVIEGEESYTYVTPDSFTAAAVANSQYDFIASCGLLAVLYMIIILCIYLLMKLEIAGRIKYLGILRSIGVTKKNILFRFSVENVVLFFKTVFPGYLAASIVLLFLEYNRSLPIASEAINYPVSLCIATGIILFIMMVLTGLLPPNSILSKSPSDIMAKYDI